jgi:pimeloyl-ACP methyl ester carboxylesterase
MRYTISPVISRLLLPGLIKAMFAPASVPDRFDREFPTELMLRPSQLRASAEDAAMMTPVTIELQEHYRGLKLPVVIVTGADDQIADVGRQSERLHGEIVNSGLMVVPGMGHMIHHLAPDQVVRAVELASKHARAAAA